MAEGNSGWILMICREGAGEVRYAGPDGTFVPPQDHICAPYIFPTRERAMNAYVRWAQRFPADAADWWPRIVEAVDT